MAEKREGGRGYVAWEEVVVSNDRGRREVHYYLKRGGGGAADLAVVGREKSVRHMSYAAPAQFVEKLLARPSFFCSSATAAASPSSSCSPARGLSLRWRSRREVVDWLSGLVSDSHIYGSSPEVDRFSEDDEAEPEDIPSLKDISSGKMAHLSKEFSWLGSAWNCRKRRKHYRSFCRNGITISVHDFVYIMAEENKRLIAYVEDLYEDMRANKMAVVRWFLKVDEVGIVLPPDISDREIFFSLCLQDSSVECIEGLAAVLSAQHFEKFQNEGRHRTWEPYMCRRKIDNDDVKPFDITQVQGYWSQELLRSMYASRLKLRLKITYGGSSLDGDGNGCSSQFRLKRNTWLTSGNISLSGIHRDKNKSTSLCAGRRGQRRGPCMSSDPFRKDLLKQRILQQQLSPGCHVEVLSQDSGIRGCWFRCVVLKRHHDKVKVRYQDIEDADETGNLEEWVLASKIAAPDKLNVRLSGRPVVRPHSSHRGRITGGVGVGAIVDAWWHDGWWEGIVIGIASEQEILVYFPGEQQVSSFSQHDLRQSQDWVCNKWNDIEDRPEILSLLPDLDLENQFKLNYGYIPLETPMPGTLPDAYHKRKVCPPDDRFACNGFPSEDVVPNLVTDCMLDRLRWSVSKKRKRGRELNKGGSGHKRLCDGSSSSSRDETEEEPSASKQFVLPKSLTVDQENCKVGGDPLFGPPITLSSLVMSR